MECDYVIVHKNIVENRFSQWVEFVKSSPAMSRFDLIFVFVVAYFAAATAR